jgi:hypothetical protein
MELVRKLVMLTLGGITMTQFTMTQTPNVATDPRIDPQVRTSHHAAGVPVLYHAQLQAHIDNDDSDHVVDPGSQSRTNAAARLLLTQRMYGNDTTSELCLTRGRR